MMGCPKKTCVSNGPVDCPGAGGHNLTKLERKVNLVRTMNLSRTRVINPIDLINSVNSIVSINPVNLI